VFRSPASGNQQNRKRRSGVSAEGFDRLGLGQPSTLWLAGDQPGGLSYFQTRIGFPWTMLQAGGGSLALQSTWLNGEPIVQIVGGGANATGLSCDGLASGSTTLQFSYTWSFPILWPAVFAAVQRSIVEIPLIAAPTALVQPFVQIAGAGSYNVSGTINGSNQTPPTQGGMPQGFDTTVVRRGIVAVTSDVRLGNRVWQVKVRTASASLDRTSPAVTSVVANPNPFASVRLGCNLGSSSNVGFGGACCWKGIGASDAQLTAILDNWENLYPLS
jgi:hypothetical protein